MADLTQPTWWGKFRIPEGKGIAWRITGQAIYLQHLPFEWRRWQIETERDQYEVSIEEQPEMPLVEEKSLHRFLLKQKSAEIHVRPALADRPVVARPAVPLELIPGESAQVFVTTPLWFQALSENADKLLFETPIWRPSDSWFGPNTMTGELCYAKYTQAKLDLSTIDYRAHQAISMLLIENTTDEVMRIEKLNLPVTMLNLYSDTQNRLWTESISAVRESSESVEIAINKVPPKEAGTVTKVASAREKSERRIISRAFNSLFA